jgi:hypothetical protein
MNYRPPLANQLFDLRFGDDIALFPKCQPVIPYLQQPGTNVERVLEKLQGEANEYPERHRQLAAIRYYLQTMLSRCLAGWAGVTKGVTNYKTLLDQIAHRKDANGKVCLVTFNYDTLLEDALPTVGVKILSIPDYISTDYQIIKLHGSINWAHEVNANIADLHALNQWKVVSELIDRAPRLVFGPYETVSGYPISKSGTNRPLFPALAIPVESKPGYECPQEQLNALENYLPQVTKVLVIGWRAAENRFLQSLATTVGKDASVMVISSTEKNAANVIETMKGAGVSARFIAAKGGFSNAILSGETDGFLTN